MCFACVYTKMNATSTHLIPPRRWLLWFSACLNFSLYILTTKHTHTDDEESLDHLTITFLR